MQLRKEEVGWRVGGVFSSVSMIHNYGVCFSGCWFLFFLL